MNKYNFDHTVNRINTASVKWGDNPNILPMWVADMDYHVLPAIKEALNKRIEVDAFGYVECPKELFKAYQDWWKKEHSLDISIDSMVYSQGVVASIDSILKHIIPPHSEVIVQTPVYHVFFNCIKNNGHTILGNKLIYDNGNYHIDYDHLEQLLKRDQCKALILCNPHNPIGRIWSKEELKEIVDLCDKYNVLIISDEIHCDITEPGYNYHSLLEVSDKHIVLLSPTKVFNIAGIQSSVVVVPNQLLREKIEKGLGQDDVGEPNYFSCDATIAAFTYGNEWVKELNEYLYNNKRYIESFLKEHLPNIHLVDNHATYLLWLDISHYSSNSEYFSKSLKEKTGLFVSSGYQFGEGGETFLRMNIATSLDNVKDACNRLLEFIKDYYE